MVYSPFPEVIQFQNAEGDVKFDYAEKDVKSRLCVRCMNAETINTAIDTYTVWFQFVIRV